MEQTVVATDKLLGNTCNCGVQKVNDHNVCSKHTFYKIDVAYRHFCGVHESVKYCNFCGSSL